VQLSFSEGGHWGVQSAYTIGGPCFEWADHPIFAGDSRPRDFPQSAQVTVRDQAGNVVASSNLQDAMNGTIGTASDGQSLTCDFPFQLTVPPASFYSFEFPNATTQRYASDALPTTVVLDIGGGNGFTPPAP
jgi:hypothetical protein